MQHDSSEEEIAQHLAESLSWDDFASMFRPDEIGPEALRRMFESAIEVTIPLEQGRVNTELSLQIQSSVAKWLDSNVNWDLVKAIFEEAA